jgi:hypothetical protein
MILHEKVGIPCCPCFRIVIRDVSNDKINVNQCSRQPEGFLRKSGSYKCTNRTSHGQGLGQQREYHDAAIVACSGNEFRLVDEALKVSDGLQDGGYSLS